MTIAPAGVVEGWDTRDATEKGAGLGGERMEEEIVDGRDYVL
jgi:hypothetical protein